MTITLIEVAKIRNDFKTANPHPSKYSLDNRIV